MQAVCGRILLQLAIGYPDLFAVVAGRSHLMALDAGLRNILQSEQSGITLTIQLSHLLPILRKKRLVTEPEFQQLSSDKESDSEKNGKLIRIIIGKGEDAFDLFIEALQEEQEHLGHSSLARKLMDEKKRLKAQTKPEPLPRSKKPLDKLATSTSTAEPKSDDKPQQVSLYRCS